VRPATANLRWAAPIVAVTLALAACGSQLDPATVAQVNGTVAQDAGAGGVVPGSADVPGATGSDSGSGVTGGTGATGDVGGTSGTGGSGTEGTGSNAADGGLKKASCDGFKNQTGVTDDEITIANASDISGPVPGLFESAQLGVRAYVAYFNATSDICGRKLKLLALDSKTDAGGDQTAYAQACDEAFAAVGSQSVMDSGGAQTAEDCGIPDLRSSVLTTDRSACSTCFGVQTAEVGVLTTAFLGYLRKIDKAATDKAAFLYLDAGGSAELAKTYAEAAESIGYGVEMVTGIDATEFNYAPYVQQLKDKGITYVNFVGATQHAVRFADAMKQQHYVPKLFNVTQTQYSDTYVETGGDAVEGTYLPLPHPLFTDKSNTELQLYQAWLQQVKPGVEPSTFGVFGWSAARLFVEKALKLGGKLSRDTLLDAVRAEHSWDANGMHSTMDVGAKTTYKCTSLVQLVDGVWRKVTPGDYICGDLVRTSVAR
jgi:ABC-type branched-subunit amino acid transport system substrate-binding protein